MRQGRNLVSNSDFNRKRIRSKEHIEGGEEYLKSSYGRFADGSNASVLISSSFASENIVGGGQLRSNNYSASSRSIKGKRAYAHFKGGEGNYTSLMSSSFAGTETMLNPGNASFWNVDVSSRSDHIVGGGRNPLEASASGMQAELVFLDSSSKKRRNKSCISSFQEKKGGKPFNRLASYTRNDFSFKKGGAGYLVCTPFHYEGGVELRKQFWSPFVRKGAVC